jgi:hypothetical protein
MEIWKDIVGYEGLYQISNFGRLKSIRRNKVLFRNPAPNGYITYSLWINNTQKTYRAHRLVAEHFLTNSDNLPIVDHIDGVRHNNHVDNLRWVNHTENINNKHEDSKHAVVGQIPYTQEELDNEVWVDATKVLPELEGKDIFMVSNLGRIKVPKRGWDGKNNVLTKTPNYAEGRYPRTSVTHNGKTFNYTIHRLVARCFIGEVKDGYVVDHIDRNIYNPRLTNLQIITIKENNKKAVKVDDKGCNNGMSNHEESEILEVLKSYFYTNKSKCEISRLFGMGVNTVRRIVKGETYNDVYEKFMSVNSNFPKRPTQSELQSLGLKGKKQKKITCPHCNKLGGVPNMKRYHFDNCKKRV